MFAKHVWLKSEASKEMATVDLCPILCSHLSFMVFSSVNNLLQQIPGAFHLLDRVVDLSQCFDAF